MKKYFLTSAAALAFCGLFTSCTHDLDYDGEAAAAQNSVMKTYEQAFITAFGQPDPNNDWGFGTSTAKAATRTITVNGDAYDKFPSAADISANFPTAIPEGAKTEAQLETLYKEKTIETQDGQQTLWNLYHIYMYVVGKTEMNVLVNTPGEFSVGHSYNNPANQVYNVYINIGEGNNLTLKRNGAEHVNFYIMSGNITIDSNFGECGGIISVASGATVNDQRNHIAHNDGVKIFNKGTYNSTNSTNPYWTGSANSYFDIGNFCTFYNEGKFTCLGGMSYSPGDTNDSYFINLGDEAELTAPSMTLNSAGNFFNSGKVNISGETLVTQARIYWVNDGFYRTGSMTFSAKNATFYNYCQLIVEGNAHMYDGEFNLMENSYTEAGTAEMDNFIVNMGSNTGMYIKGNVRMIAQGDGTYQGFKTNGGSNDYLLIDGKVTVDSHKKTFSISNGITYSINNIEIVRGGQVVSEDQLKAEQSGDYPVLDFNGTECPYGKLSVTPNTNSCGANWHGDDEPKPSSGIVRVICEDLSVKDDTDWDFNDAVFDVQLYDYNRQVKITLRAAGGTLPLYIGNDNEAVEIHAKFKEFNKHLPISTGTMLSTGSTNSKEKYDHINCAIPSYFINNTFGSEDVHVVAKNIPIKVQKLVNGEKRLVLLMCEPGKATAKVAVNKDFEWCDERVHINDRYTYKDALGNDYGGFTLFVRGFFNAENWPNYNGPITDEMRQKILQ